MPAPAAAAKKKKAKTPTIKNVSPMRVAVGRTITIRGKNFSSSRRKNTVVFRSPGKRTAFAKPKPRLAHQARGEGARLGGAAAQEERHQAHRRPASACAW